ncbi:MAG: hypothetical protein EXS37_14635 [Opitutus sp.]|nr:hypothetical protein [Opitutus sp.]
MNLEFRTHPTRRDFIARLAACGGMFAQNRAAVSAPAEKIRVGINTSSFAHQRNSSDAAERIRLEDIPAILRDELDMNIIDLESVTLGPRDLPTARKFRVRAEAAGCRIINLKVNAHDLPFDSEDIALREHALTDYRAWIEIAAALGARSLRPYPATQRPRLETLTESYARLADHGDRHGVVLLIENYKWIETEPKVIPEIIGRLGGRIKALVDTGNWADAGTRRAGLAAAFPHALTCDFKVRELSAAGEHAAFDLEECFMIGRRAGYTGPWCLEHTNPRRRDLLRELRLIKSKLEALEKRER